MMLYSGPNGNLVMFSAPSSPTPPGTLSVDMNLHRTRPAIALDPTQPLRVDGKPRERVYAACERW